MNANVHCRTRVLATDGVDKLIATTKENML
jgi:hypothetical protein